MQGRLAYDAGFLDGENKVTYAVYFKKDRVRIERRVQITDIIRYCE